MYGEIVHCGVGVWLAVLVGCIVGVGVGSFDDLAVRRR